MCRFFVHRIRIIWCTKPINRTKSNRSFHKLISLILILSYNKIQNVLNNQRRDVPGYIACYPGVYKLVRTDKMNTIMLIYIDLYIKH